MDAQTRRFLDRQLEHKQLHLFETRRKDHRKTDRHYVQVIESRRQLRKGKHNT